MPFLLTPDGLPSSLINSQMVYELPSDLIDSLDTVAESVHRGGNAADGSESEESGDDEGGEQGSGHAGEGEGANPQPRAAAQLREAQQRGREARAAARHTTLQECLRQAPDDET